LKLENQIKLLPLSYHWKRLGSEQLDLRSLFFEPVWLGVSTNSPSSHCFDSFCVCACWVCAMNPVRIWVFVLVHIRSITGSVYTVRLGFWKLVVVVKNELVVVMELDDCWNSKMIVCDEGFMMILCIWKTHLNVLEDSWVFWVFGDLIEKVEREKWKVFVVIDWVSDSDSAATVIFFSDAINALLFILTDYVNFGQRTNRHKTHGQN